MSSFILCLLAVLAIAAATASMSSPDGLKYMDKNAKKKGVKVLESGLHFRQTRKGNANGLTPNKTSTCHVNYRGKNVQGNEFDASKKHGNDPMKFAPKDVIKGWTEALMMMKEGEKAEIVVPAELAYGKRKMGEYIVEGSVLIFDIELVKVELDTVGFDFLDYVKKLPMSIWAFIAYFIYQIFMPSTPSAARGKKLKASDQVGKKGNKKVFLDVAIHKDDTVVHTGRIEMELFNEIVPQTAENFFQLCTGEKGIGKCGKPLHFKDSIFHRIIPGFMAQGGDFQNSNGPGGESIYGNKFEDEFDETKGYVAHNEPYLLSMANSGPNTNGSQFFITFANTTWLDTKHIVFGKVVKGSETVERMQKTGAQTGNIDGKVFVQDCGALPNSTSTAAAAVDDKKTN